VRSICKNPGCPRKGEPFIAQRPDQQYCTGRCRVAAHRKRHVPLPSTWWIGEEPGLGATSRSLNADGTLALSNEDLGGRLIEIARTGDGGEPKTGRRFYYLALSYGYIQPDMSATDAGRKSRDAAYQRITRVLGVLRKQGEIGWDNGA
jgi:hypothetical protein